MAAARLRAQLLWLAPEPLEQPEQHHHHQARRTAATAAATATAAAAAAAEGPLTPRQLEQWRRDGFVVLQTEAPPELLAAARGELWRLAQRDESDRATWYRRLPAGASRSGTRFPFEAANDRAGSARSQADLEVHMLGLWQTQSQWSIRQLPRIHACFAQLWGTRELWVSVDCVNLKPPVSDAHPGWGGHTYLHWDWNLAAEGLGIQGALYLSDTTVDGGGFRMIPGFAARFNDDAKFREQAMAWRAEAADNAPGGCKDLAELTGMPTVTLPGKAGDLVICASSSLVRSARQWRQCATTAYCSSM